MGPETHNSGGTGREEESENTERRGSSLRTDPPDGARRLITVESGRGETTPTPLSYPSATADISLPLPAASFGSVRPW